jgi:hypothetical protein
MAKKNHQPKTGTFSLTQLTKEDLELIADGLGTLRINIADSHDRANPLDAKLRVALRERASRALALKAEIE